MRFTLLLALLAIVAYAMPSDQDLTIPSTDTVKPPAETGDVPKKDEPAADKPQEAGSPKEASKKEAPKEAPKEEPKKEPKKDKSKKDKSKKDKSKKETSESSLDNDGPSTEAFSANILGAPMNIPPPISARPLSASHISDDLRTRRVNALVNARRSIRSTLVNGAPISIVNQHKNVCVTMIQLSDDPRWIYKAVTRKCDRDSSKTPKFMFYYESIDNTRGFLYMRANGRRWCTARDKDTLYFDDCDVAGSRKTPVEVTEPDIDGNLHIIIDKPGNRCLYASWSVYAIGKDCDRLFGRSNLQWRVVPV